MPGGLDGPIYSDDLPSFEKGLRWDQVSMRRMQTLVDSVKRLLGRRVGRNLSEAGGVISADDGAPVPTKYVRRAQIVGYDGNDGFSGYLISGGGTRLHDDPITFKARIRPTGDDIHNCLPNLEDCFGSDSPACWEEVVGFQEAGGSDTAIVWYVRQDFVGTCLGNAQDRIDALLRSQFADEVGASFSQRFSRPKVGA